MSEILYECHNAACPLGTVGAPGQFTSGAGLEYVALLTGRSADELVEGTDYGDGFCPNCAVKGIVAGTFTPLVGDEG